MMIPNSEQELAELIAAAKGPLQIKGGGTRGFAVPGDVLDLSELRGVTLYEPGALTLVVRAGTPLREIEATLAEQNQRLAFEPMDHQALLGTSGEPTIGGVVAANISGPRRVAVGAARDHMLGVRFVDGAGNILKNGGRVMKNVTGYDLVKLMTGSYGTLGVISEVSLKVLPKPETQACVLINNQSIGDAVRAMSAALASPYEVSGAAHTPAGIDGHPVTMIRVEGFAASTTYRAGALRDLLAQFGDVSIESDPAKVAAGWTWVRNVEGFATGSDDIWRISVKPSDAPAVANALASAQLLLDWGGGLIWAKVPAGTDVRTAVAGIVGHATLIRASAATKVHFGVFHPEADPLAKISAGLRARFDPRGILNSGLMG